MKSFKRIKKINGKEYLYEITPYYDKKTKKIRQKSKYLGKYENGELVKPKKPLPKLAYSFGEFIPYLHILRELGIEDIFDKICTKKNDYLVIKTLVLNRLIRPLALQNIKSWHEGTIISKEGEPALSSQSLSRFLSEIGDSSIPQHFITKFVEKNSNVNSLMFDITSLSSYSKLNSLLEYGFNKDNDGLPQFNLSLAVDKEKGIPLMYDIYPGSIKDVTTIKNSTKKVRSTGLKFSALVLDRGFFSTSNLDELINEEMPFIIGVPFTLKEVKKLISNVHKEIEDPELMRLYNKKPLFVKNISIALGPHDVNGFLFYDLKREQDEKNSFYTRLYQIREMLLKVRLQKWMNPERVFERIAKDLQPYFECKVNGEHFQVKIRKKAVSQRINRMGKMVFIYNGNFDWRECLGMYGQKDVVEKCFRALKKDILASPLNAQKQETARGLIFITYLALILRFKLLAMMKESGMDEKYSVEGLMLELEKIKKIELQNGDLITTEIGKKQRNILEGMKLCA